MELFKKIAVLVAIVSLLSLGAFASSTATGTLNLQASITNVCNVVSGGTLDFGAYDPVVANKTTDLSPAGATFTVQCTQGTTATVTMGQGTYADTGSTDAAPLRRLKAGTNYLSYQLFSDSGRLTPWNNTAGTGVSPTWDGTVQTLTVYGTIPQAQNAPQGTYTDSLTITITY